MTHPTQAKVAAELRALARSAIERAENLATMAEAVANDDNFLGPLASEWTAPGYVAQVLDAVDDLNARPGSLFGIRHALTTAVVAAQKEVSA